MKKIIYTLFLLFFSTVTLAQLEEVVDGSFGAFTPLFQYQGNLYVRQNIDDLDTQGYDYQYYKINIATNAVTQLSFTETASPYFENGYWASVINNGSANPVFNPQYYGNTVYFSIAVGNQIIVKINTQTNLVDIIDPSEAQGCGILLFNDRLYYGCGGNNNYPSGHIDLSTGANYPATYPFAYDVPNAFVYDGGLFMSLRWYDWDGEQTVWSFTDDNCLTVYPPCGVVLAVDNNFIHPIPHGFYPKGKPIPVNNRLLYRMNDGESIKTASFNTNDVTDNPNYNILDINETGNGESSIQDYLILNDGVIFYTTYYNIETGIYSYKWYKTNGINNAVEKNDMPEPIGNQPQYFNLNSFFQTYSDWNSFVPNSQGNSFVKVGNTIYFSTYESVWNSGGFWDAVYKLYKINSINAAPVLIQTFTNSLIQYATEIQGNLVFYSQQENVIYTYNGTELIIDPQLNNFNCAGCRSLQNSNVEITGIFKTDDDYLLINTAEDGLFKIENETLSNNQNEVKALLVYPNPVSEILNFSEELSDIQLFDITGRTVKSFAGNQNKIDVSDVSKGSYIIKATTKTGKGFVNQIIKN